MPQQNELLQAELSNARKSFVVIVPQVAEGALEYQALKVSIPVVP